MIYRGHNNDLINPPGITMLNVVIHATVEARSGNHLTD